MEKDDTAAKIIIEVVELGLKRLQESESSNPEPVIRGIAGGFASPACRFYGPAKAKQLLMALAQELGN